MLWIMYYDYEGFNCTTVETNSHSVSQYRGYKPNESVWLVPGTWGE